MKDSFELNIALFAGVLVTVIVSFTYYIAFPELESLKNRREKRRAKIRELLQKKLDANIQISAKEISDIGFGAGASPSAAIEALYELYAEAADESQHQRLRRLIDEMHQKEPFEHYPAEVRPSLARIAALCEVSDMPSDRELLHPLKKILEEYVTMKQDHQSIKRQNRIVNVVAIVSFFIGVVGLFLAFTGPSKEFIASEIRNALKEAMTENPL